MLGGGGVEVYSPEHALGPRWGSLGEWHGELDEESKWNCDKLLLGLE